MQGNRSSKYGSIISVQSRRSNLSNPKSLGRPSFDFPDISLQNKTSLVQQLIDNLSAMSIQSENRKSDIFERLLQSEKKTSQRPSSIIGSQSNYNSYQVNSEYENQRNSQVIGTENQVEIDHECACYDNCLQTACTCYLATHQICVKGHCCSKCVQIKTLSFKINSFNPQFNFYPLKPQINSTNHNTHHTSNNSNYYLSNTLNPIYSDYPNNNQINMQEQGGPETFYCNCKNTQCLKSYCKCFQNGEFCSEKCGCESCKNKHHSEERYAALQAIKQNGLTYCTCKKTKCNKKYCSCYAQGLKCGKHCSCQNCTNCQLVNEMDLEVYQGEDQEDLRNTQMPERMSFEPANFC